MAEQNGRTTCERGRLSRSVESRVMPISWQLKREAALLKAVAGLSLPPDARETWSYHMLAVGGAGQYVGGRDGNK